MKTFRLTSCILVLAIGVSVAADLSYTESTEYAKALRLVLNLPGTGLIFDTNGALVSIACPGGFDDRVASALAKFPYLRELRFHSNELSSHGFRRIRSAANLELLSVGDVTLNNDDLAFLGALPKLSSLELGFAARPEDGAISHLTDEVIDILGKCTRLKTLVLSNARISEEALAKLQKMLPNARIESTNG